MAAQCGLRSSRSSTLPAADSGSALTSSMDATEMRVTRPPASPARRLRFVSGKARGNTVKTLLMQRWLDET